MTVYNSNSSDPPVAPVARSVVAVVVGGKQGVRYRIDTSPPHYEGRKAHYYIHTILHIDLMSERNTAGTSTTNNPWLKIFTSYIKSHQHVITI